MIANNGALVDITEFVGPDQILQDLTITANATLPTCQALNLLARIAAEDVHGNTTIAANDDAATCP